MMYMNNIYKYLGKKKKHGISKILKLGWNLWQSLGRFAINPILMPTIGPSTEWPWLPRLSRGTCHSTGDLVDLESSLQFFSAFKKISLPWRRFQNGNKQILKIWWCAFFFFPGNDGQDLPKWCQWSHSESMSKDVPISPRSKYLVRSDENGGFGQIKKIGKQSFFSTES